MRNARNLRTELDLWKLAWQQVETFLDRIEGAQDQDRSSASKVRALLRAARAVEHQRAARFDVKFLCDPFVDRKTTEWSLDYRKWRIPGADELELAAGNLLTDDSEALEAVMLLPPADLFQVSVEPSDPRASEAVNGMVLVRLPSYPSVGSDTILGTPIDLSLASAVLGPLGSGYDITEQGDTSSLFSRERRKQAATDIDHTEDRVRGWSDLCRSRRAAREAAQDADVLGCGSGSAATPLWQASLDSLARSVIANVLSNTAFLDGSSAADKLGAIAAAASGAATTGSNDAADLSEAKTILTEEGTQQESLLPAIANAETALGGQPQLFLAVAAAATALAAAVQSPPLGFPVSSATRTQRAQLAATLTQALDRLAPVLAPQPLFLVPVEDGPLALELDRAVAARLRYPDGTLRLLRALETAFLASWPGRLVWLHQRYDLVLRPLFTRVRLPFVAGLRAMLRGGPTGLPIQGLELRTQAPVGGETLSLEQPASMLPTLQVIETGHVGVLAQDRPTAAVILGLAASAGRVELNTLPLRVSIASAADAPGSPGVVSGGQEILSFVPGDGFTDAELRSGEASEGPGRDGLMQQTLSLWSRLALIFGRTRIDHEIEPARVPDPSTVAMETLGLFGEVPAQCSTIVIAAAPDAFWNRAMEGAPEPRIARAGEILLLRGRGEPNADGTEGPLRQSAVEIDSTFRTTGAMLQRMDTSSAALLSTIPASGADATCPALLCGSQDDVIVLVLKWTCQRKKLIGEVTLRRDFVGFDLPSLATERLLPAGVLDRVLDPGERIDVAGLVRDEEFAAALETIGGWTRYAR
jgi:hypothetical protein